MTQDEIAFVNDLIGTPWKLNGYGPDVYDCWGCCVTVQNKLFNRLLPRVTLPETPENATMADKMRLNAMIIKEIATNRIRRDWLEIPRPVHGCLVQLAHVTHPAHLGTYLKIDGGGVLHAHEDFGVIFEDLAVLKAQQWHNITFLLHGSEARG